jgi:glycosyltransferase involved in cell wall biosynthesis
MRLREVNIPAQQNRAEDKTQGQSLAPTRIAYLLNSFPCLSETFILQEILELEHQGLPLRLFSLSEPPAGKEVKVPWSGIATVTYISRSSRRTLLASVMRRFFRAPWRFMFTILVMFIHYRQLSVLAYLLYAAYLAEHLQQEGIVHLHAHYATEPASVAQSVHLLTGISYSFTAHAYDIYLSPRRTLAYKMQRASFVVTCTSYNRDYLAAIDPSLMKHIHCIYHGLNFHAFPAQYPEDSVALKRPLVLAVARLIEKKGLSDLLRACRILKDRGYNFTCRIVGDGPLYQALEEGIGELGLTGTVDLWGKATHKQVIEMYRQATVFALPCVIGKDGDRDGIPNVLVEAMYMGTAVVSTPISGIPELISEGINGLLVPPQDSAALAAAMSRLLDDPVLRDRLVAAGQQTVRERFDMAHNSANLLHLLSGEKE